MSSRLSIVHLSTADAQGGSARSARRIHEGLRRSGHTSRMLVGQKSSNDPDVDTVHGGGLSRKFDRLSEEITRRLGLQYLYFPSSGRVRQHDWITTADIIQIYNTHGGYLSHRLLPALASHAPVVWRLSDMWAVTGHCAYAGGCERWRTGCGQCPDLGAYPPIPIDTTAWLWRLKHKIYRRARPTIVAPSSWAERIARESPLFEDCEIRRIPNGIDQGIFSPRARPEARRVLGWDADTPVVAFSAQVLDDNERKGSAPLVQALNRLADIPGLTVALIGEGGAQIERQIPQRVHRLGFISDKARLATAYAAADIIAAPSVVENLPNSVLEGLACGTPVIAFDCGGLRDAVRHDVTGWLVAGEDTDAFAAGLRTLLADGGLRARLGRNAAQMTAAEFTEEAEIGGFVSLYRDLLQRRRQAA